MEAAYGIGVQNRYALFLDEDGDSPDPYALLANPEAGEPKAKATAAGGKSGPKTGVAAAGKPGQKPAAGALTESKANVAANQKDAGKCHSLLLSFFLHSVPCLSVLEPSSFETHFGSVVCIVCVIMLLPFPISWVILPSDCLTSTPCHARQCLP